MSWLRALLTSVICLACEGASPTIARMGKQVLTLAQARRDVATLPVVKRAHYVDDPRLYVWDHFQSAALSRAAEQRGLASGDALRAVLARELAQVEPLESDLRALHAQHPRYRFEPYDAVKKSLLMEATQRAVARDLPSAIHKVIAEQVQIDLGVLAQLDWAINKSDAVVPQP